MLSDITYIVRFYKDGSYSDEVWHNTEHAAREHLAMFDESDGYSDIELLEYDWVKRRETQIDAINF